MEVKRVVYFDIKDLGVPIGTIHNRYDELEFVFDPKHGHVLTKKQMLILAAKIDTITADYL